MAKRGRSGKGADKRRRYSASEAQQDLLYGLHAARAVLRNDARRILRVMTTENAAAKLHSTLAERNISPEIVSARALSDRLGKDTVHQGIAIVADPLPEYGLGDILAGTHPTAKQEPYAASLLVVLDQVTDPHNAGAVLRSCAAFAASAVVMTRRNSPPLDGALAKAASGALEHVPVLRVANLARALQKIGDAGVFRIGLEGTAEELLENARQAGPCALVLGAEGKGLRRLTRENCDLLCRIATSGPIASLNVSNAAAVALHIMRQSAAH